MSPLRTLIGALMVGVLGGGCDESAHGAPDAATPRDLRIVFPVDDFASTANDDMTAAPDPCGDTMREPFCRDHVVATPFPLRTDAMRDPAIWDDGLVRTKDGFLQLAPGAVSGVYRVLVEGCFDQLGLPFDAFWYRVNWSADTPPGASIAVRAQTGNWPTIDDAGWQQAQWTVVAKVSPLDLQATLTPNLTPQEPGGAPVNDHMLRVEVQLTAPKAGQGPVLRTLDIAYKCIQEG